jgi:hypothetical protein
MVKVQFQWSQANNLSAKFRPLQIFLSLVLKSTATKMHLKWTYCFCSSAHTCSLLGLLFTLKRQYIPLKHQCTCTGLHLRGQYLSQSLLWEPQCHWILLSFPNRHLFSSENNCRQAELLGNVADSLYKQKILSPMQNSDTLVPTKIPYMCHSLLKKWLCAWYFLLHYVMTRDIIISSDRSSWEDFYNLFHLLCCVTHAPWHPNFFPKEELTI